MRQHVWDGDESLLDDLRGALNEQEVPPEFIEAARAAFTWRTIDAELLAISYDSVLDDDLMARARSTMTARQLIFDADGVSLQLEVTEAGITGQLVPPRSARVELLTPNGVGEEADTDELGCFLMGPPRSGTRLGGPIRFRIDGSALTDWICL